MVGIFSDGGWREGETLFHNEKMHFTSYHTQNTLRILFRQAAPLYEPLSVRVSVSSFLPKNVTRILGHRYPGKQGHQDTRTLGHKDCGTQGQWDTRTMGHKDNGTPGQWNTITMGHRDNWTMGHRDKPQNFWVQSQNKIWKSSLNLIDSQF